ncbi:hypothetical protein B0H12DRAFT_785632 [Mycena haematopus]|nr:hypothetical protein B0H12DRAFT_785632 [Mycena haematopus]
MTFVAATRRRRLVRGSNYALALDWWGLSSKLILQRPLASNTACTPLTSLHILDLPALRRLHDLCIFEASRPYPGLHPPFGAFTASRQMRLRSTSTSSFASSLPFTSTSKSTSSGYEYVRLLNYLPNTTRTTGDSFRLQAQSISLIIRLARLTPIAAAVLLPMLAARQDGR